MLEAFLIIKMRQKIPTDTEAFFHRSCLSSQCENYEEKIKQRSEMQVSKCLIAHVLSSS